MSASQQNIKGQLGYTERLVALELERRRQGLEGLGTVEELARIERVVWQEEQRQHTREAYEQVRHPLGDLIVGWPSHDPLTVALQAIVDHTWLPVEVGSGGRFSFPDPGQAG